MSKNVVVSPLSSSSDNSTRELTCSRETRFCPLIPDTLWGNRAVEQHLGDFLEEASALLMRLTLLRFHLDQVVITAREEPTDQHVEHLDNGGGQFLSANGEKRAQQRVAFGGSIAAQSLGWQFADNGCPLPQAGRGHGSPHERGRQHLPYQGEPGTLLFDRHSGSGTRGY